jgi:hypothetical protein
VSLRGILDLLERQPPFRRIDELAADPSATLVDVHAPTSTHPLVAACLQRVAEAPLLLVTASGQGAEDMAMMLRDYRHPPTPWAGERRCSGA